MSKAAIGFLLLALLSCAVVLYAPLGDMQVISLLKATTFVFAGLFAAALVVGRKIKFDPVLR